MKSLLKEIRSCSLCKDILQVPPNPIIEVKRNSKIILVSQAPGRIAFEKTLPWDDPGGRRLREWLGVDEATFFTADNFAIFPMAFCYPGKAAMGDLPPSPICAPTWHDRVLSKFNDPKLFLLIGKYAQDYYLKDKKTLTTRVQNYQTYRPKFFPIPHPSPVNRFWMRKNPWYLEEVVPILQQTVRTIL